MRTSLLIFTIVIIFVPFAYAQYDETFYTITAPSGLSLREGPGTDYERLGVIPFDTQVTVAAEDWHDEQRDTINEVAGHWVPIRYQQQEGYVFSSYLKWGHLFTPSENGVNKDYRVVIPGMRFSSLNYDSDFTWYALVALATSERGQFRLEEVDPTVNFAPMSYEERFNWGEEDGLVSIDVDRGEEYVALLIGTRQPIAEVKKMVQHTYYNPESQYQEWGRPVYPYQQLDLFQFGKDRYALSGHVSSNPAETDTYNEVDYYLGISKNRYAGEFYLTPDQPISAQLSGSTYEHGEPNSDLNFREHPRIFWRGDLNGDTLPDLIFYQPNTSECCGGSEAYFLLLSTKTPQGEWSWKRVAYDVLESFGGC